MARPRRPELSPRLAEYRQRAGLTQEEVAERIGISADMVRKHERGINQPIKTYREQYCLLYQTSEQELGIIATSTAQPTEKIEKAKEPPVLRRDFVKLGTGIAVAALAGVANESFLDPDEQERLSKVMAVPSRVDEQSIDSIEAILQDCKRQDDVLGPHAVLHTVLDQRELVGSLLGECPDGLRPRLLSVYSSMSSSIGTYFFDLDDPASVMHYYDQARAVAHDAHNTELAIYALCEMSYFASWQGKAYAGIDFAAAAQNLAGKTDDVLLKACAAERAGTAYATDGQYKECMIEFDRALAGFARPEVLSPVYWYDEGLIASRQSDCLLRLDKPAEAAATAQRGLQLLDRSFTHGLAYCTLRLGTARLLSGEVEEAV